MVLTVFTLFIMIIFGICFYVLISRYSPVACETLLNYTKLKKSSFILEAILIYVSKITHSMMHSNIVGSHNNKLICLISFDLMLLVFIYAYRKNFLNKFLFIAFVSYRTVFIFLNSILLLHSKNPETIEFNIYEKIIFYTLISLASLTLLKIILCIISEIY